MIEEFGLTDLCFPQSLWSISTQLNETKLILICVRVRELCTASATPPHMICRFTKKPLRQRHVPHSSKCCYLCPCTAQDHSFHTLQTPFSSSTVLYDQCWRTAGPCLSSKTLLHEVYWWFMAWFTTKSQVKRVAASFSSSIESWTAGWQLTALTFLHRKIKKKILEDSFTEVKRSQTFEHFCSVGEQGDECVSPCVIISSCIGGGRTEGGLGGSLLCLLLSIPQFYSTQPFDWEADHIFSRFLNWQH